MEKINVLKDAAVNIRDSVAQAENAVIQGQKKLSALLDSLNSTLVAVEPEVQNSAPLGSLQLGG